MSEAPLTWPRISATAKVQGITLTVIVILAGFCSLLLWYLSRLKRRGKTAETANKKLTEQVAALENRIAKNENQLLGMALTDIRLHKMEIKTIRTKKALRILLFSRLSFQRRRLPTLPHCIAVPSAQAGLTSLFGMGRGGTPPQ